MARASKAAGLAIWMNGERVGLWREAGSQSPTLEYDAQWLTSPHARPLSLSLPFTPGNRPHRGTAVSAYFDNLLPDSPAIRQRLAARYGAASTRAFALLREIGRDCVGAVQLMPEDQPPPDVHRVAGVPLSTSDIAGTLAGVVRATGPARDDHDFRISIAGAQEKTALLWHDDQWQRPVGTTPSTHIFKLPLGRIGTIGVDLSSSVENEWLCAQLLHAYGLPVAECDIGRFDDHKALVVKRFDRSLSEDGRWWVRIPQEDLCQALAVEPWRKYEADGGPGMRDILGVLDNSTRRDSDRVDFFRAQLLFWMLAATDGHAKNFSLFIGRGGTYRMTPLYDVISAWPVTGKAAGQLSWRKLKLAMALRAGNAHYHLAEIQRRHWNAVARRLGLGMDFEPHIQALIEHTPCAIAQVAAALPANFPAAVAEPVFHGLQRMADLLERMPAQPGH